MSEMIAWAGGLDVKNIPLLQGVELTSVAGLLSACPVLSLEQDGVLLSPGEPGGSMFLVLSGRLSVHIDTVDNEPVIHLEPGSTVGELSVIDNKPRSAYVVGNEASTLLKIDDVTFWRLVNASHEIALNLLSILSERMRGNNSTIMHSLQLQHLYKRHASVDGLTGLYNRRWLNEVVPRQMRRSEMGHASLSLIMADVDHFKKFNDTHGHAAGDFVLFVVAQVLKSKFRPTDLVARYGGEEFTILLPETSLEGAIIAANRVCAMLAQTPLVMDVDGEEVTLPNITISMGVAEHKPPQTMEELFQVADANLYRAKKEGRNRCVG